MHSSKENGSRDDIVQLHIYESVHHPDEHEVDRIETTEKKRRGNKNVY